MSKPPGRDRQEAPLARDPQQHLRDHQADQLVVADLAGPAASAARLNRGRETANRPRNRLRSGGCRGRRARRPPWSTGIRTADLRHPCSTPLPPDHCWRRQFPVTHLVGLCWLVEGSCACSSNGVRVGGHRSWRSGWRRWSWSRCRRSRFVSGWLASLKGWWRGCRCGGERGVGRVDQRLVACDQR